jgi:deazaflavin-dependent oxidoreductase (nitroreductase family)
VKDANWVPDGAKRVRVTTTGRRSGKKHTVPLWYVTKGPAGPAYLWHNKGKTDWMANIRARGGAEIDFGDGAVAVSAARVEGPERDWVVAAFLRKYMTARLFQLLGWTKQAVVFRLERAS